MIKNGIYHVYNRGINKEKIFASAADKNVFRKIISESQMIYNFRLFAYSIMNTHYHLVFHDVCKQMSMIIGTIQENYAKYYNAKYNRSGPVFSSPFQSKIVITLVYFFILLSYVLNNPVEAGIVEYFFQYPWNSEIVDYSTLNLIDTQYLNYLFKEYIGCSLREYIEENSTKGKLCDIEVYKMKDLEAMTLFTSIVKSETGNEKFELAKLSPASINNIITKSYYQGISIRQLNKFTGITNKYIRDHKGERDYL